MKYPLIPENKLHVNLNLETHIGNKVDNEQHACC